jgi:membrane-bound acyltransferase YfiQ involved in biofilm formation
MGVRTRLEIDGNTMRREGFRQIQTSWSITTLRYVFWCIMIYFFTPTIAFYIIRWVGLQGRSDSAMMRSDLNSISTYLIYNIYLLHPSGPHVWAAGFILWTYPPSGPTHYKPCFLAIRVLLVWYTWHGSSSESRTFP